MNTRRAHKLAQQLGSAFDTYFKNHYVTRAGKHWREKSPETAADLAAKTITTNCEVSRLSNSTPSTFAFRFDVKSSEPRFVDAAFYPEQVRLEIERLFHAPELNLVNSAADLRRGELTLAFKERGAKNYYHFNFRIT